jgi:putative peptide zinc metalloprotease protein
MADAPLTFSESWYRIAQQRVALRSHVTVRRQFFRGERWYVLQDPFNNQFYRLRPPAYEFVVRLRPDRTVDAVWNECFEADPENAPGQEEALGLLAQLYAANLLHSALAPDSAQLFERYKKRRQQEKSAYLLNIMFARVPLLDPDAFLKRCLPLGKLLFGWVGLAVWLLVVLGALKTAVDHFGELRDQTQGVLAPGNLFWLYVGLVLIKTVHEFGHAFACRRFGGEVHTMGVMFLLFTPVPYMDATASWSFRSRWHRALVGAAGMIVEVFVAALAMFVWASTGNGPLHSVAYNMIFVAGVTTVFFNANPLLRFDGYYILSDLLDIPNLHQRSTAMLRHFVEFYGFGYRKSVSPARSRKEAGWLTTFAIASGIYKFVVFSAVLFLLADRFLILGILMAAVCAVAWVCVPVYRLIAYLSTSPRLDRTRLRAVLVTVGAAAVVLIAVDLVPFPNRFRAPGVLQAKAYAVVAAPASGVLVELLAPNGATVASGQPLFRMENHELDLRIATARAQLDETDALQRRALRQATADLAPLASRAEAMHKLLRQLEDEKASLVVRAAQGGQWVAPALDDLIGAWVERGTPVGQLVDGSRFYFSAIVSQNEASRLFANEIRHSEVKLNGQAGITLQVTDRIVIPADRRNLPSAALGWAGGGQVAVNLSDNSGTQAAEPFFEVRATVQGVPPAELLHGRGGRIRFELRSEPLLDQWIRRLRQLLQNRYGI